MKKERVSLLALLLLSTLLFAQSAKQIDFPPLAITVSTSEENSNEVMVLPNPIVSGEYFRLKYPDREVVKRVEVVNMEGERVNKTEITFSKMGLYMPKVEKGFYLLKVSMDQDTILKKVWIE